MGSFDPPRDLPAWEAAIVAADMKATLVAELARTPASTWRTRAEPFLESLARLLPSTPDAQRTLIVDLALEIGQLPLDPVDRPADEVEAVRAWLLALVAESIARGGGPPAKGGAVTTSRQVQRIRARRAAALLGTGASVEAAAALVGYDNLAAFFPIFHRVFGCSPAEYRARVAAAGRRRGA